MKNLILLFFVLTLTNFFSQKKITTSSELLEWKKKKEINDSLKISFNGEKYVDSVLILLNKYRIENGCNPLVLSDNLSKVAYLQSKYCADNLITTHDQEDESLSTPFDRGLKFNERDVMGEIVSECSIDLLILKNKTIPSSPIENFKKSSGHSGIMKDPSFKSCGISMVQSEEDKNRYYTVIVFSIK